MISEDPLDGTRDHFSIYFLRFQKRKLGWFDAIDNMALIRSLQVAEIIEIEWSLDGAVY